MIAWVPSQGRAGPKFLPSWPLHLGMLPQNLRAEADKVKFNGFTAAHGSAARPGVQPSGTDLQQERAQGPAL